MLQVSIDNVSVVEDLSGDFQFSRGSAATRVNAQGLVENVQIISEELVSNGDFSQIGSEEVLNGNFSQIGSEEVLNGNFSQEGSELITNGSFNTDSNWTLSSGITYNANGYIDFDGTQGGGQARNTPNITFVQGKTYKVVYEIKNYVSGAIKFRFQTGWNTIGQQQSGNGLKTEYIVCNDSSNNNFQFFNSPSFIGSIDNVSVKEVGQNWSFSNDVSVGNGVATFLDGGSNPNTSIKQSNILTSGKTYKLTFNVSRYVNGRIQVFVGSSASTHNIDISNGVGTYTLEATSTGTDLTIKRNGTYPNFDFDITNISVKEVGQNWTLGSDWSIGDNKAVRVGTSAGNLTQSPFTIGKTYKVSWEQSNGFIAVYGNTLSTLLSNTGNEGVHTVYFTPTSSDRLDFRSTDNDAEVTNISVKEVGQDWTLGTGWSIGDDEAVATSGASTKLTQSISGLSGKYCKVSFNLSDYGGNGSVRVDFGSVSTDPINTNGEHIVYGTYDNNAFELFKNTGFEGSITNISVKEITDDTDLPRINYSGFSYQDSLGSEEVVNGDFATDSNWVLGVGWSIENGYANANSVASGQRIKQDNIFEVGKIYKITYEVKSISSGGFRAFVGGVGLQQIYDVGVYTEIMTTPTINDDFFIRALGTTTGSIDNVSVKEYLGQEVVPDSGCGNWLLEPQSTNLVTYSEDFSNSWWNQTYMTVSTTEVTTSPDGSNTAQKFTRSAGAYNLVRPISGINGLNYSLSVFVKNIDADNFYIRTASGFSYYNFASKTTSNSNLVAEEFTDGWVRLITSEPNSSYKQFGIGESESDQTETDNQVYIWGAQLEQQSYATSYIPTNGATSTRLQDIANNSGNATLINSTEGVLYAEIASLADDGANKYITVNNGGTTDYLFFRYRSDNNFQVKLRSANTDKVNQTLTLSDNLDLNKIAFSYKENEFKIFVNGSQIGNTITTGATSSANTLNKIDLARYDGASNFIGKTKTLAVYKEALTDANLRCLTYPNPVATTFDLNFSTIADDFTFTRGSEATFVNEQGLIQSTNQIGSELITNGGFDTDSDWNKGVVGWLIQDGKAIGDNSSGTLNQNVFSNILAVYKVSFDLELNNGALRAFSGAYSETFTSSGTKVVYVKPSTGAGNLNFSFLSGSGSIDNVSVKEVTTATNTPRIDYSTGEAAFLLEPQSTNTVYSSNSVSFLQYGGNMTLSDNAAISPDGTFNAMSIVPTATQGVHRSGYHSNAGSYSQNDIVTFSCFVKANGYDFVTVGGFFGSEKAVFNISNGTLVSQESNVVNTEIVKLTNDWYRLSTTYTFQNTIGNGYLYAGIYVMDTQTGYAFTGDGVSGVYAYGFQAELGTGTSYIPTNGASATRNQEICKDATPVINSEEGTLYAEISALANDGTFRLISISDGTNSNRIHLAFSNNYNKITASITSGGVSQGSIHYTSTNLLLFHKIALKYKLNDFQLWIDGIKVATDTSATMPTGLNRLNFTNGDGVQNFFFGNTKGLKYYPKALADVQLEDLTTI